MSAPPTVARGADPSPGDQVKVRVLFLCTHNSARSQMAEGWLRAQYGDRFQAHSAGTAATPVRPLAIRAMAEVGVDIAGQESKTLDRYRGQPWDYVVTVCDQAAEACPVFPGAVRRLHWSLPDPSKATGTPAEQLATYRQVRDALRGRIDDFVRGAAGRRDMKHPIWLLARGALAEFLGTGLLLNAIIGSGIAAQRLSPGDAGLQLLENAIATAAALVAIILAVGPVSGAHLNPVVTLVDCFLGGIATRAAGLYVAAQVAGAAVGAMGANAMFALPALQIATKPRTGAGLWLGEVVATFGLVLVVFGLARSGRAGVTPFAVGAYIAGAYWFTSSTSFANPAVTLARTLSDTFAGINPGSAPAFMVAQLLGGALGLGVIRLLYPDMTQKAPEHVCVYCLSLRR